jgi:hypothetical protein
MHWCTDLLEEAAYSRGWSFTCGRGLIILFRQRVIDGVGGGGRSEERTRRPGQECHEMGSLSSQPPIHALANKDQRWPVNSGRGVVVPGCTNSGRSISWSDPKKTCPWRAGEEVGGGAVIHMMRYVAMGIVATNRQGRRVA